jgi:competence protein ComEC
MGGITIQHYQLAGPYTLICLIALVVACAANYRQVAIVCVFSFALGSYVYNSHILYHRDIAPYYNKTISLNGYITSIDQTKNSRLPQKISLKTEQFIVHNKTIPTTNSFFLYGLPGTFRVGDKIHLKNIMICPPTNRSFEFYSFKEGVSGTIFARPSQAQLTLRPVHSISRFIQETRNSMLTQISETINGESKNLVNTIFFGNRAQENSATKTPFKQWGISHYLARSGLHLVMLIVLWRFLFSLIPLPFFIKELLLIYLILFYSIMSWSSISFTRAFLIFLGIKIATFLKKPVHYIHHIFVVCLAVLIHNPFQLFFLDFQLSFGLTLAIAWLNHLRFIKEQQIT